MVEKTDHIYCGFFHSQFVADYLADKPGWKFMNFRLEQRFIFKVERKAGYEEYLAAKESRFSAASKEWQSTAHSSYYNNCNSFRPHVFIDKEQEIEVEFLDQKIENEICSELLVEFYSDLVPKNLKQSDFFALKDNQYHGRITGYGYVRIPTLSQVQKTEARNKILNSLQEAKALESRKGCRNRLVRQPNLISKVFGFNASNMLPGAGLSNGCGRTGCGCLSLLLLLGLLLFLLKGCLDFGGGGGEPRVIHDTVFVDEKSKEEVIKRFIDTTTILKTNAVELPNVQFYTNSAKLLPYSISSIQELANYLTENPNVHSVIEGHTDNVGKPQSNLTLSQARAETVRQVLISFGVDPSRVEAQGFGSTKPRESNETVEGRALNRRVEVRLTNTEATTTKTTEVSNEN
jgi:outer membrane protein OmpA-like peptidoglycan-associated protein